MFIKKITATGGKGAKGAKKPIKQTQNKPTLVAQNNKYGKLEVNTQVEKPKELDKEKFKGKSFIFMEEIYAGGEIDLSEFDVLSPDPCTNEERDLLVENILAFLSEKNKDVKLASKLIEELFQKKFIYPNNIEHGFTTIINNFIDIVDDLPNFPTRIATMLSGIFPSILPNFNFLNKPLSALDDEELSSVVTNFVADLVKLTTTVFISPFPDSFSPIFLSFLFPSFVLPLSPLVSSSLSPSRIIYPLPLFLASCFIIYQGVINVIY